MRILWILFIFFNNINILNAYYLRVATEYLPPVNMTGRGLFMKYNKNGERIDETVEEVNKNFFLKNKKNIKI
jgi:hypothetical protein